MSTNNRVTDTAADPLGHKNAAAELAASILGYFESYKLAAIAPIVCEIEAALDAAYMKGINDEH